MTGKMNKRKIKGAQTVSDGLRSVDRAEKRADERHRSRRLGLWLIGAGGAGLLLILLFLGIGLTMRPSASESVSPWDFSDVKPLDELKAVPSAHGWSALDSFYASHPEVEGEEEYYLDPALWREPKRQAPMADTLAAAPAVSRRTGLWNGPADGMLSVDTSIRPLQEQLKRQGAMQLQVVSSDSLSMAGAADTTATYASGYDIGMTDGAEAAASSADAPTSEKPLHVEFWESPVHYKGYQLSGNNLILYGINDSDSLRFENHVDGVWMYHKEAIYRLTTSTEMQRFELISGTDSLGEPAADDEKADETEAQ